MKLGKGYRYSNGDILYVSFQKHHCPHCNARLETNTVTKKVKRDSPEGQNYDFVFGSGRKKFLIDEATFAWKEFDCPQCGAHFTVEELQRLEGVYVEPTPKTEAEKKREKIKGILVFIGMGVLFILLIYFVKNGFFIHFPSSCI